MCPFLSLVCGTCSCWSSSLDNAKKRHTEKSTKHWFSIYQLVGRYLEEQGMDANTGTYTRMIQMLKMTPLINQSLICLIG